MKHFLILALSLLLITSVTAQRAGLDTTGRFNGNSTQQADNSTLHKEVILGADQRMNDSLLNDLERKLFGYSVFHNPNINFTPNLNMATPRNYVVGPGDVLNVQVYGVAQNTYALTVDNEGNVNIIDIGVAHVGGLTIEAVKDLLERRLALRYAGMRGDKPNTFIEVTLARIRSIKVNMVGEIFTPGTYTLPSYVNVFNALFAAGGPTVKGTFRYIQVYRNNRIVGEIDLYDYLVNGKASQNIRLEDNDVVLIRPSANQVEMKGEVRIPGIFELKPNETFQDLVKFAGGFKGNAYKDLIRVQRKGAVDREIFDIAASQFQRSNPRDGDIVIVDPISNRYANRVQVAGSVNRPGAFELVKGMTLKDLLQKAGGLKGDAFKQKAFIYRTKADFTQEVINVDLSQTSVIENFLLEREDVLSISSIYDLKQEYYVQITGEVNNNGIYPYNDSMTVAGLIVNAGGFKYSASGSFIEIVRRNNSDPTKVADIITVSVNKDLSLPEGSQRVVLQPFDHVFVRNMPGFQLPKLVTIQGEVLYTGTFAIDKKEMRISDLLVRAGGLSKYAYAKGATLLRKTKSYAGLTPSEIENLNLQKLLVSLTADTIVANTESNNEYIRRIQSKIDENSKAIAKEQEFKKKEVIKKEVVRENAANIQATNTKIIEEKEEDLVALDLDAVIKNPGGPEDLVLKDGDVFNIPEKLETVSVKGGVLYPVSVRYEPGISFNEYINRAGGYDPKAIRKKAYVIQANGKVQRIKSFLIFKSFPKVEPGAEVVVPATLTDKPPVNYAGIVSVVTGFITSVVAIVFLFRSL